MHSNTSLQRDVLLAGLLHNQVIFPRDVNRDFLSEPTAIDDWIGSPMVFGSSCVLVEYLTMYLSDVIGSPTYASTTG